MSILWEEFVRKFSECDEDGYTRNGERNLLEIFVQFLKLGGGEYQFFMWLMSHSNSPLGSIHSWRGGKLYTFQSSFFFLFFCSRNENGHWEPFLFFWK